MQSRLAKQPEDERASVEPTTIRIGKDVIELVTSGMYVFPVTVYREYVQNAADAIDSARAQGLLGATERGQVSIQIDHAHRTVAIRDNGCGIPSSEAEDILLAIGGSPKRGTGARGFRGVGRLSGLAYCREIEFLTKAAGDPRVVSLIWDCRALRARLADNSYRGDVRDVIASAATIWTGKAANPDDHFFEVRLRDVVRHRQDMLLNDKLIAHYLSQVSPLPFSDEFTQGQQIEEMLGQFAPRVPLDLTVGGEPVCRPYRDEARVPGGPYRLQINEIEFVQFADVDGEVGAIGWLGHHDYTRSIHSSLGVRGLRARIGDIQIGEPNLLDDCFRETRFNGWSVGEIHVLDRRIVPNGRRDNFELNHHAYNLLTQIGPITGQIAKRCRVASVARNSSVIIKNTIDLIDQRIGEDRALAKTEVSKFRAAIQRSRLKLKGVTEADSAAFGSELVRLEEHIDRATSTEGDSAVSLDEALALVAKYVTNREQARNLSEALRGISG
jgi:hypothetical protein